jgi:glutamate racemase
MNNKAIGVFDSGIGGLTVYRSIKDILPGEKIIYLGDTARLPYGTKSAETIIRFSEDNARFLLTRKVKIIVVACNSSASYAVEHLQETLDVPVLGVIEPGAEAAVKMSEKKIGVVGTLATIRSGSYEKAILARKSDAEIISQACPLFVPLVEEGWIHHPVTQMVIQEYLDPLKRDGIGSLVLGCTHYPVLKDLISRFLGGEIRLIDSAETAARKVSDILNNLGWLRQSDHDGSDEFFVTDFPDRFKRVGEIFLRKKIDSVSEISL